MASESKRDALSERIERVRDAIQKFPAAAATLNSATDQLGKPIADLDTVLKKFSLGVPTWVHFSQSDRNYFPQYYYEDIGYAKINGKWGIAIRTVEGNEGPDDDDIQKWPFNDAPRLLRLQAVDKIPDLLEALLKNAAELSEKMTKKTDEIVALTDAISSVAKHPLEVDQDLTGPLDRLANSAPRSVIKRLPFRQPQSTKQTMEGK